jgi:succinate dehydrogenase/fumarate reductase-like Fe-S protein
VLASEPFAPTPHAEQTSFTLAQLADPDTRESEKVLRACVHCGFCTATCPTYVLLGDELDGPRGCIYLMKQMFENDQPASEQVVKHIDRRLSCLACMTTCPSGAGCPRPESLGSSVSPPGADGTLRSSSGQRGLSFGGQSS